jgi:hypothetical protein
MKYIATITDEDIRFEIETAATELEEDNQISFPDSDSRAEFLDDCITCVMDKLNLYETYMPDYRMEVLDLADTYGYQL